MPDLSVFNAAGDLAVLTAAQIAAPNAEILAAVNTIYRLNVAPYTRYVSDGTALLVAMSGVVDLTAAQIAAPTAAILANTTADYRLNVAPYTRYYSNGTALVSLVPSQSFQTVDNFGAVGDGRTFDDAAFTAYAVYLRAQVIAGNPQNAWVLGEGKRYLVSRSVDCTLFSHFRFLGNGSIIQGWTPGTTLNAHPIIDFLGSDFSYVENLRVEGGTQANPALTGLIFGVYNNSASHSSMTFENVEVDGYFTRACIQNSGSEVHASYSVTMTNRYTSGVLGNSYCSIQDGTHHWALGSSYVTDTRTLDTYFSFINAVFSACVFYSVGDGSAIWTSCPQSHHYDGGYVQVAQDVPIINMNFVSGRTFVSDFTWNVHSEIISSAIFQLNGISAPSLNGLIYHDEEVQAAATGFVFVAGSGVTSVKINNADIYTPFWLNAGAKMFDQPTIYTLTGKVTILSAAAAAWVAPANCSIDLITDTRGSFTFGAATRGRLIDGSGIDIVDSAALGTIASAATITLGTPDVISLTGSVGIGTVAGQVVGREWKFLPNGAPIFTAGASISNTFTPVATVPFFGVSDGTKLWLK